MSGNERTQTGLAVSTRVTYRLAALMLIGFVLTQGRPLLIPLVLAGLLAFLMRPLVLALTRHKVPPILAILFAQGVAALPIGFLVLVFTGSVGEFSEKLPAYQTMLTAKILGAVNFGLAQLPPSQLRHALEQNLADTVFPEVMQRGLVFAQSTVGWLTTALVDAFLMLIINLFMLMEAHRLREKIVEAFGLDNALLSSMEAIGDDVRAYVVAKTAMSALTGALVWILLAAFDVDFAALWALLAFPLNFIPTVGAVVASLPPMIVASLDPQIGALGLAGVCGGLFAVNGIIGSFVDPRFVGRSVEISPLVVFLSMLVWGFLWGPVGTILAVPIMVSVKVVCSHIRGLERIAILLKA